MNQLEFAEFLAERKKNENGFYSILPKIGFVVTHPTLHIFIVKLLQFLWVFIYVSFTSWLIVLWILYGILELKMSKYLKLFDRIYFPLISICCLMMYVSNIHGVLGDDCYNLNF